MKKYIGMIDKNLVKELMDILKRMEALVDLKSTILDLRSANPQEIDISGIDLEEIEKKIAGLLQQRLAKYEEIRIKQGWTEEFIDSVRILENSKVYVETDK